MDNPYEVLGVSKNATQSTIKTAFRKRAMECHPDQASSLSDEKAKQRFIRVRKAFDILKDKERRRKFDSGGKPDVNMEPNKYDKEWKGFRENADEVVDFVIEASIELGSYYLRFFGNMIKGGIITFLVCILPSFAFFSSVENATGIFVVFTGIMISMSAGALASLPYAMYSTQTAREMKAPWVNS